jgi:hypothetical protein
MAKARESSGSASPESRIQLLTRKLSHRYEQLTAGELLADVEVDIFRPWAYHATWKDTVVAVGKFRRLGGARLKANTLAVQTCSTSQWSVVGAC